MTTKNHLIHLSIQVVPLSPVDKGYPIIDRCLEIIKKSELNFKISAMETTIEGTYDQLKELQDEIYQYMQSTESDFLINTKIHARPNKDISFLEKGL